MKKIILNIEGMTCSACSNAIEKYLNKQKGIIDASVNLVLGQALVCYEDNLTIEDLAEYVNATGYKYNGIYDEKEHNKKDHSKVYLLILGILLLFIMYISMGHMIKLPVIPFLNMHNHPLNFSVSLAILSIVYLIYGRDIIVAGFKNLKNKTPNMDTLVTLGVSVSFGYSLGNLFLIIFGHSSFVTNLYFESVCMIIFFIKLGRYIDKNSKEKTKEAIEELVKVTPEKALRKSKTQEEEITIDEVKVGDVLIVKPGMKVAVDGEVIKGSAHFDESFITGESAPSKKSKGQKVVAGAINYDGVVEYKAEKIGPKSTISEMVHLVLEASNTKMPIARIADKVSSYFVPSIMLIALLTFGVYLLLGFSFNEALISLVTVLVVACPCALGLATPLAVVVSVGTSLQKGILIKSSETLEIASLLDTIVFDKTGTLTNGKLSVSKIFNYSNYSDQKLLNIVSNIEKNSSHPISQAFASYKQTDLKVLDYQELAGVGLMAKIGKKQYLLGSAKILKNVKNPYQSDEDKLLQEGNSIVYVTENAKIIALIGIKDVLRQEAKKTIEALKRKNLNVIMLSGDNEVTANFIGQELGIEHIVAGCLPRDKTQYIKDLRKQGHKVAMVGDGINDAPSLTTADVGISFKSSTDIATNSASVIITNDNIHSILEFLNIGKKTLRNIKQNLFWAFFYNILMIPIAMGLFKNWGLQINPMLASGTMMLSSLCVVFNALRLKK